MPHVYPERKMPGSQHLSGAEVGDKSELQSASLPVLELLSLVGQYGAIELWAGSWQGL